MTELGSDKTTDLSPVLIGRERELGLLLAIVAGIQDHGGHSWFAERPGIGKSALLEAASALSPEPIPSGGSAKSLLARRCALRRKVPAR